MLQKKADSLRRADSLPRRCKPNRSKKNRRPGRADECHNNSRCSKHTVEEAYKDNYADTDTTKTNLVDEGQDIIVKDNRLGKPDNKKIVR